LSVFSTLNSTLRFSIFSGFLIHCNLFLDVSDIYIVHFNLTSTPKCLLDLLNVSSKLNFYSSIRDIFMLLNFCLSVIFLFKLLILLPVLFPFPSHFPFIFFFLFFFLSFSSSSFWSSTLFFVWTSVLSFCLIILVFARMSLRVNNSARWFFMILHACWVSECWGGRRFELFIEKITSNPHYLITLKNSWSLFLEIFW